MGVLAIASAFTQNTNAAPVTDPVPVAEQEFDRNDGFDLTPAREARNAITVSPAKEKPFSAVSEVCGGVCPYCDRAASTFNEQFQRVRESIPLERGVFVYAAIPRAYGTAGYDDVTLKDHTVADQLERFVLAISGFEHHFVNNVGSSGDVVSPVEHAIFIFAEAAGLGTSQKALDREQFNDQLGAIQNVPVMKYGADYLHAMGSERGQTFDPLNETVERGLVPDDATIHRFRLGGGGAGNGRLGFER